MVPKNKRSVCFMNEGSIRLDNLSINLAHSTISTIFFISRSLHFAVLRGFKHLSSNFAISSNESSNWLSSNSISSKICRNRSISSDNFKLYIWYWVKGWRRKLKFEKNVVTVQVIFSLLNIDFGGGKKWRKIHFMK